MIALKGIVNYEKSPSFAAFWGREETPEGDGFKGKCIQQLKQQQLLLAGYYPAQGLWYRSCLESAMVLCCLRVRMLGKFSSTRSNFEERRSIQCNQLVQPQSSHYGFNPDFLACPNLSGLHRTPWVALYARFSRLQSHLFRHSVQCNCLRTNAFLFEFGKASGCGSPTKREGNNPTLRLRPSMILKEVIWEMSNGKKHQYPHSFQYSCKNRFKFSIFVIIDCP